MKRRFRIVAVTLAVGFALAGCGTVDGGAGGSAKASAGSSKEGSEETGKEASDMDMQEAADRSDSMLDAVLEQMDPEVQWAHGPTTKGGCDVTRRRTVMTIVSAERRQSFLDQVEKFWLESDYRIKARNKDEVFPAIYAQTKAGFGISVSFRGKGQAFFEADSPCVEESGVADSASEPNGPAYEGVYPLPRPNVRSDYWSGELS
ncbi:hypothetical protein ACFWVP_23530 [Streptomyces sp. NPDC058637]|uniref:hypothetical protein n=1 Tax=Streptomyces sp. NPDC058637 TaxID=3346569 RepID=UPI003659DB70